MTSNITGGPVSSLFTAAILGKYEVSFFRCLETGYVQTDNPYWLNESYASPISISDTGVLLRNSRFLPIAASIMHSYFGANGRILDYAGGYGVFTRMMRDAGFDCYWQDRFTTNLHARGFEYDVNSGITIDALSAFEVFEHLVKPREEMKTMLGVAPNILFSTLLLPNPIPGPQDWWYYALESGQHVSFYTRKSLEVLASENALNLVTNGLDLHLFLSPDCLPNMVSANWLRQWLRRQSPQVRTIISKAYVYKPIPRVALSLKSRLRILCDKWRLSGLHYLREGQEASSLAALRSTTLSVDYAGFLIENGWKQWPLLSFLMHSRTMDDMMMLREKMKTPQH